MNEFTNILVPTDFGDSARRALDMAVDLSEKFGASLTLLHAYEIPLPLDSYQGIPALPAGYWDAFRDTAQRRLDEALAELQKRIPAAKSVLRSGAPWEQILEVAKLEHASHIVMGTHGHRGLKHVILGSVAKRSFVCLRCPC